MPRGEKIKKIIIYFLLAVMIAAGGKTGFDAAQQVAYSYNHTKTETLDVRMIAQNNDCWMDDTGEKRMLFSASGSYGIHNQIHASIKYHLSYGLFVLLALSIILSEGNKTVLVRCSRYACQQKYMIIFIQDMDGRKKPLYI